MKILHVAPSFYPATYWGGPIWSTKAICDGIAADPAFELRVLTTDAAGSRVSQRVVPAQMPYQVHYARRDMGHSGSYALLAAMPAAISWADVVHLTGTYSAPTLPCLAISRRLNRPLVWSPRGALQATQDWDAVPRRRSKRGFARLAGLLLPARTVLHVTSDAEAQASLAQMPRVRSVTIPNAIQIPDVPNRHRTGGPLRLMFLSRLHPKKGIERLLAAMPHLRDHCTLDIYGTGEASYLQTLRDQARGLPVRFHGHVDGRAKSAAFADADIFVLPSYSENFGIAIAEALAHAVPVLTTDATPWQAVVRQGCGTIIDARHGDLVTALNEMAAMDLPTMGRRGRRWMARDFAPDAMHKAFAALYRQLADSQPAEVAA